MAAYRRQHRKDHPMIAAAPVLPRGCSVLWVDFMRLHKTRGSSGMAQNRIGFRELAAFEQVNEVKFAAWEIDAILGADDAYFASQAAA